MLEFRHTKIAALLAITAAVSGVASPAHAGPTLTFNLNQISDPSIGSGSQGTVTLTQFSATTVDVTVAIAPDLFINTGGPHTPFAFDTTVSGLSASFITPPGGVFAKGTLSYDAAGGSNTPYGSFSRAIDSSACNGTVNGYGGILEFALSLATGLSTTDFVSNAGGYYFSADVSNGTNAGAIASFGPIPASVPEPASMTLLGAGLFCFGVIRHRKTT
jgi:hypothetical protein